MGGLRNKIPITFWTMFIATLAIAGIPGLLRILQQGRNSGSRLRSQQPLVLAGWVSLAAGLTSFYMFRLMFLTFFGEPRYDEHQVHVHESPKSMTGPADLLAILSDLRRLVCRAALLGRYRLL